ncbi:hypothetical protein ACFYWD_21980 [Streptomyces sp. NPDC003781]|uniref:hypothetical protein n=1 Tax=Streptomyces sp. NPDC003781 TaxID=3364686 RepID=UPI0036AF1D12
MGLRPARRSVGTTGPADLVGRAAVTAAGHTVNKELWPDTADSDAARAATPCT